MPSARHDGVGDVLLAPVDQDAALLRALEARHALHQRALARAVLAKQRMHGAGLDAHRHAVHGGEGAEAFGELVGVERESASA